MNVTAVRKAIEAKLADETGFGAQVWLAPTEYAKSFGPTDEVKLGARLLVGPADEGDNAEAEEKVDQLFEVVPGIIREAELEGVQDAHVASCKGHQLFGLAQGEPPIMGTEFTILVVAD